MWASILAEVSHALAGTHYLQHIDGTAFIAAANLELADKLWVLGHQQVHEVIDLKEQRREGCLRGFRREPGCLP